MFAANNAIVTRKLIRQWISLVTALLVKIICESPHLLSLFSASHVSFFICIISTFLNTEIAQAIEIRPYFRRPGPRFNIKM